LKKSVEKTLTFSVSSFSDDPFTVVFDIKSTNPTFGVQGERLTAAPTLNVRPLELNPAIYIDQRVLGQALYSSIDITMDGIKLEGPNLVNQAYQYQAINRTFCTDKVRREKYGTPLRWVANTNERQFIASAVAREALEGRNVIANVWEQRNPRAYRPAVKQWIHPNLENAMQKLDFGADELETTPVMMNIGFDGYFPISSQCNALYELTKQKNDNQYLRPGSEIVFQLIRRMPQPYVAFDRVIVPDREYFGFEDIATGTPPFVVTIKSITLTYESIILQNKDHIEKLSTKAYRYLCDVPFLRENKLDAGGFHNNVKIPLPKGTKLVFLYFCFEGQIIPNSRRGSFLAPRFRFAPNLDEMRLHLLGRENLVVGRGLRHLGNAEGRRSESLRTFHALLVRQGLYTRSFDDWFPKWVDNAVGYDQVIPVDLTYMAPALRESVTSLEVDLVYKDQAARPNWVLRSLSLVERCYEYSPKTSWTWKDL
jgi:hypothetical protein